MNQFKYPVGTKLKGDNRKPCTVIGYTVDNNGEYEYVLLWETFKIKDRWSKDGVEDRMELVSLPNHFLEELFVL